MISSTDSINPSPDFFWFDHGSEKPCSIISTDTPVEPGLTSFESPLKSGGCNCTRSKCLKNYCPCHRDGNKCNESCHCTECKNTPFIPKRLTYLMGTIGHFSALPFTLWRDHLYFCFLKSPASSINANHKFSTRFE